MSKKILSLALAIVMVVLAIPAAVLPAFAADDVAGGSTVATSSSFSDLDIPNYYKDYFQTGTMKDGDTVVYPNGWDIGGMSPTDWNSNYYTANIMKNGGTTITCGGWMSGAQGAGYYCQGNGTLILSANYEGSPTADWNGDGSQNNNDRLFLNLDANVLVRYTAPADGGVTIKVPRLVFGNTWASMFCILVDGKPVGQFDVDGFDYATGAGWFKPTEVNSAASIEDIVLNVTAGQKIDFVFRGTGADAKTLGAGFNYGTCKYAAGDWGFEVVYNTTANTGFNINENFFFEGFDVDGFKPATGSYAIYDGTEAWQGGVGDVVYDESKVAQGVGLDTFLTVGGNFRPISRITYSSASERFFAASNTSEGAGGAICVSGGSVNDLRLYLTTGADHAGYRDTTGDGKIDDGDITINLGGVDYTVRDRKVASYVSTASLRYTAQFTGKATFTIDGGWYSKGSLGYQYVYVLKNGTERLMTIKQDAETETINKTIELNLVKGDTIDLVAVVDPRFSALAFDSTNEAFYNEETAKQWAGGGSKLLAARRSFVINDIDVTYSSVSNALVNTLDIENGVSVVGRLGTDNDLIRFFQWVQADGTFIPRKAGGANNDLSTFTGARAVVSSKVLAQLTGYGITENSTWSDAFDAWVKWIKATEYIKVSDSAWGYGGALASNGTGYEELMYPTYFIGKNFLLIKSNGINIDEADGSSWYASEFGYTQSMAAYKKGVLNSGIVLDLSTGSDPNAIDANDTLATESSLAKNVYVPYASDVYTKANAGGTGRYAYDTVASAMGKNTACCSSNTNYVTAYKYTAQATGVLNLNVDSLTISNHSSAKFYLYHNGVKLIDGVSVTSAAAINALLTDIDVIKGDVITLGFGRDGGGSRIVKPIFTATVTAPIAFENSVALTINDAYGVNVVATPSVSGGVVSAIVGETELTGKLNANGTYSFVMKEGVNVSDLTATRNSTAAWDNLNPDGVTIAYQLKEVANGHTLYSRGYSITTDKMLEAYESGAYGTAAATLAKDIRHLAVVSNAALNNPDGSKGDYSATEKNYIRGKSDAALTELKAAGALHSFTGEAGKYSIVAANVNLDNRLSVVILMAANEGGTLADLRDGGYYVEATNSTAGTVKADVIRSVVVNGTEYMGVIVNVPISMWDQNFAYTIKDAEGNAVSKTLNYSVKAWCVNNYPGSLNSGMHGYVVRAMYNLGNSAAAYKASL